MRLFARRTRSWLTAALAACVALTGCAVTDDADRRLAADGAACPDVQRPLPFPVQRPECWTDEEWQLYLKYEAERARNGDRYNEWSFF